MGSVIGGERGTTRAFGTEWAWGRAGGGAMSLRLIYLVSKHLSQDALDFSTGKLHMVGVVCLFVCFLFVFK